MIMTKEDLKKYYQPKASPQIIEIPTCKFITISGQGNPNGKDFQEATQALFSLSYALKMSYKKENPPKDYYEYKVFPLEGVWDLIDTLKPSTDKDNYAYTIMIQQPDFLHEELFQSLLKEVQKKKSNPKLGLARYEELTEGLCCQMLHIGPYDDEPESFRNMEEFIQAEGFKRQQQSHREIYLSDPRKTEPRKMKTILRFLVSTSSY